MLSGFILPRANTATAVLYLAGSLGGLLRCICRHAVTCAVPFLLNCRKACSAGDRDHYATHHLDVADLLKQYGKGPGVLDNHALEQACTAIMACQVRSVGVFGSLLMQRCAA